MRRAFVGTTVMGDGSASWASEPWESDGWGAWTEWALDHHTALAERVASLEGMVNFLSTQLEQQKQLAATAEEARYSKLEARVEKLTTELEKLTTELTVKSTREAMAEVGSVEKTLVRHWLVRELMAGRALPDDALMVAPGGRMPGLRADGGGGGGASGSGADDVRPHPVAKEYGRIRIQNERSS